MRLQRNQRLGRSDINDFLLQNQKVCENVNMIKLELVWERNYVTIIISLTLSKIQNLGEPSPTSICNLTPYI